ncbi:unnamed protein product [Meloidogyne enterolobii]|uniref:Uncharacterized protein n=1 Tax=Meloidogyne enterolobii TaxID=390850 RepID=A0ACB0YW89_MELEN
MAYTRRTANFEKNEFFKNSENNSSSTAGTSQKPMENFVSLSSINPYITCPLCNGYFVDATTVIDCLHTFCKSCLLKYFDEDNTDCPKCHYQIHQSHPSHYVAFDRTMQDIVYKLVPGMQAEEQRRREQFKLKQKKKEEKERKEQEQNGSFEKDENGGELASNESSETSKSNEEENKGKEVSSNTKDDDECCSSEQDPSLMHRRLYPGDGLVFFMILARSSFVLSSSTPFFPSPVFSIFLSFVLNSFLNSFKETRVYLGDLKVVKIYFPVFVFSKAFATINTVKRLLAYLLFADITKYNEFDIFCNYELMGRDFSMVFENLFVF